VLSKFLGRGQTETARAAKDNPPRIS